MRWTDIGKPDDYSRIWSKTKIFISYLINLIKSIIAQCIPVRATDHKIPVFLPYLSVRGPMTNITRADTPENTRVVFLPLTVKH